MRDGMGSDDADREGHGSPPSLAVAVVPVVATVVAEAREPEAKVDAVAEVENVVLPRFVLEGDEVWVYVYVEVVVKYG